MISLFSLGTPHLVDNELQGKLLYVGKKNSTDPRHSCSGLSRAGATSNQATPLRLAIEGLHTTYITIVAIGLAH